MSTILKKRQIEQLDGSGVHLATSAQSKADASLASNLGLIPLVNPSTSSQIPNTEIDDNIAISTSALSKLIGPNGDQRLDGSFGSDFRRILLNGAVNNINSSNFNKETAYITTNSTPAGAVINIDATIGTTGDILVISNGHNAENVTCTFTGGGISPWKGDINVSTFTLKARESIYLVRLLASGGVRWILLSHYQNLSSGTNWRQNQDDTISQWGEESSLAPATTASVTMPLTLSNADYYITSSGNVTISNRTISGFDITNNNASTEDIFWKLEGGEL